MRFRKPSLAFGEGYISVEEYLEKENAATEKHEYFRGRIYDLHEPDTADTDISTIDKYLELENNSTEKHEFYNGQIVSMEIESPEHDLIANNISRKLNAKLTTSLWHILNNESRIHVKKNSLFTYADVAVLFGEHEVSEIDTRSILNPVLLVEVTSAATDYYDKGEKFMLYRDIPSLREYIIASPGNQSHRKLVHQ